MPYAKAEDRRAARKRYYERVKLDPIRLERRHAVNRKALREMSKDPRRALLYSARHRAPKLGVECSITLEDIHVPERCPVFPEIVLTWGRGTGAKGATDSSATLDRVNPLIGYVPGNVRVISWRANRLKTDATAAELMAIARYIQDHDRKVYP